MKLNHRKKALDYLGEAFSWYAVIVSLILIVLAGKEIFNV